MKSLKDMQDRRNKLMESGKKIAEQRDLEGFDAKILEPIQAEIRQLDLEIEEEKRSRENATSLEGDKKVKENTFETRDLLDAAIRHGETSEEYRAISAGLTQANSTEPGPGNGGSLISETVYGQVIPKLDNVAPVFAMVHKFPSINGRLKIARETSSADAKAGFVGEGLDVAQIASGFVSVKLDEKRVGAAVQLTNDLILDAATDIVSYATDRAAKSVARAIEHDILLGSASGFRGIIGDADVKTLTPAAITVETLIDIKNSLNVAYQTSSAWVVSQGTYNQISKLKDGDGRYLILNSAVQSNQNVFGYTLFGLPIYVSDALDDGQIVFGDFDGYGLMIKQGMNLTHVTADSTQALAGGHLIVLDAFMDGAVYNPDMFIVATVTASK